MSTKEIFEKEINFQTDRRRATVELIKIISDLWYDNTVELLLFRNRLIDRNVSEILHLLEYARDFVKKQISIFDVVEIARAIKQMNLPPARLDIGKLAFECLLEENVCKDKIIFLESKLADIYKSESITAKDVVLYGFGRIGRLLARELMIQSGRGTQLRLRAIVTRGELTETVLEKRASLLRNDSVHGDFPGTVRVDFPNKALIINGMTIHVISAKVPEEINYTEYQIKNALIIDNTGAFRDKESLSRHLQANGVSKVLLTAPGKGVPNIVFGVNHKQYNPDEISIFSAASCTTNAITPILEVIEESFGILSGHLETIHAYTNDQNLVDNFHKKYRRGRAAALNMVITETGAGKAVAKALPALAGKLTSNAIRVPVPNGSLAILNLQLEKHANDKSINDVVKKYALEGNLVEQIKYEMSNELVSSDIIGSSAPAIFDSKATVSSPDGSTIIIYVWYDNEYGYSHQVMRLAKYIAKVRRYSYY